MPEYYTQAMVMRPDAALKARIASATTRAGITHALVPFSGFGDVASILACHGTKVVAIEGLPGTDFDEVAFYPTLYGVSFPVTAGTTWAWNRDEIRGMVENQGEWNRGCTGIVSVLPWGSPRKTIQVVERIADYGLSTVLVVGSYANRDGAVANALEPTGHVVGNIGRTSVVIGGREETPELTVVLPRELPGPDIDPEERCPGIVEWVSDL